MLAGIILRRSLLTAGITVGTFAFLSNFHSTDPVGNFLCFVVSCVITALVGGITYFLSLLALVETRRLLRVHARETKEVVRRGEGWRKPTRLGHLERLKEQLAPIERELDDLARVQALRDVVSVHEPGVLFIDEAERTLRNESAELIPAAERLKAEIERVYDGDVEDIILDYKDKIAQIDAARSFTGGYVDDCRMQFLRRNVAELERWRDERMPPKTKNQLAWEAFLEYAKYTAAAPIAEELARKHGRVQGQIAAVRARSAYRKLVADLKWQGRLSDAEADGLLTRIDQEFAAAESSFGDLA